MINIRESEIREGSLDLEVESYRIAALLANSMKKSFRNRLVDTAFLVSASVAKAFISAQENQFQNEVEKALSIIETLFVLINRIRLSEALDLKEVDPIILLLTGEKHELQELLVASQTFSNATLSPKLERACI